MLGSVCAKSALHTHQLSRPLSQSTGLYRALNFPIINILTTVKRAMKLAILGIVGVPGRYGGFETLAENLVHFHSRMNLCGTLTVWCSGKDSDDRCEFYERASLRYVNFRANGPQSIIYDAVSLLQAVVSGHDRILLLGVSGALVLPFIRLVSRVRVITNIDGIEWKREKWKGLARLVLRVSERVAVRFSHEVIADNQAIADHVRNTYRADCHVIAYGGDHALCKPDKAESPAGLPPRYAFALCRIEPENSVHVILEALKSLDMPLVFVGNWDNSAYGRQLRAQYTGIRNFYLLDPIYEPGVLHAVRSRAWVYLHGHSAGGTNPSLVEMMHFGIPVLARDCTFNRHSTEGKALYFNSASELSNQLSRLEIGDASQCGARMREVAQRKYTWEQVGKAYFELVNRS